MINFNVPPFTGREVDYIKETINNEKICGDGIFTNKCSKWLEKKSSAKKVLLTTSCTHALEMAAILIDVKPGDEIIMPSYTFVSTANAFVLRGAKIVFVDIDPKTMNMNIDDIENLITDKSKAIVPVHYAGTSCDMDKLMKISEKHGLYVIEDAAQAVMAFYKRRALGSIGHIGCYSFHETKNYSSGEGGAILINDIRLIERAEIIREKGTDRSRFFRGQIDKYSWVDLGSSYLPSEINAAYLYAQLENATTINEKRLSLYELYYQGLLDLEEKGLIELPLVPKYNQHNAHMFFIKLENIEVRSLFIKYLKEKEIMSVFHYIPLHSSIAGKRFGKMNIDVYTTIESERLVRLPMYFSLEKMQVQYIVSVIHDFFDNEEHTNES